MEGNNMGNKKRIKILSIKFLLFAFFLIMLLLLNNKSFAAEQDTSTEYCYLSDMNWQSGSKGYSLIKDKTSSGTNISVKIEGAYYAFDKGIWAHAASTVIYDLTTTPNGEKYDYFTAYLGLNQTAASSSNGVIFKIYTSTDGTNWSIKYNEASKVCKPGENATFVKIDISEAKFLKLEAGHNGSNGNDHSVYADAKLIKKTYTEPGQDLVPPIEELDKRIKTEFANADLSTNSEYELTLLKRELISRVGNYALRKFLSESEINKQTYEWLTSDVENIRLYIMGGTPPGGYYNSLTQLSRLYNEYNTDFTNNTPIVNKWCKEGMTRGDLYKKMAITLSLTHSQTVALWMHAGAPANKSDALRRYAIYKYMYENGKLNTNLGGNWDITKWFEAMQVEEMRFVMNNSIDDEEILWLNTYVQDRLNQYKKSSYLTPHPYMAYVWPNYTNPLYYNNDDYFNEHFAVNKRDDNTGRELVNENGENTGKVGLWDTEFIIPGGKTIPTYTLKISKGTSDKVLSKVWMNFRNKFGTGAVCGGISKSGSNIRATHGIPATVIGQPGHAALLFYSKNADGKGYWGIDNDVSGWTLSEKGERMLLGWGNGYGYSVVYMVLAQEAINDYENLVKCEEEVMLAKVYEGDLEKQEEIYKKALEIQSINIDAWRGLINVYNASGNKTQKQYYELAEDLATKLKCFPLPMYHLTNLIKPKLTSVENVYKFALLQKRILTEGSTFNDSSKVLQPAVTRTEAKYLLGKADTSVATFSFDGPDAGKIVLASKFDGSGVSWDYCLTGKGENQAWSELNWKAVSFTAEEEHKLKLTPEEIASITAENDIYIHIVGVGYSAESVYKIDILEAESLPSTLYASDLENRIIGVTPNMEWRYTENDKWTSYRDASPNLTGDKTVQIRQSATGTRLAGQPSPIYTFTQDNQPDTRKYIPVSHLSIHSVSTEATSNAGHATNAIDANYNTRYHSAYNGTDKERFMVVKLDEPVYLSAIEFVPAGGGNGKIYDGTIYGSMDGENWEVLTSKTGLTYTNQANNVQEAIANIKSFDMTCEKPVQYVKIVADRTNGNWFTARAFNFYQDITKNPVPTAGIEYSTREATSGSVVARLVNPSTEITITNNNGKDAYLFNQNGEFTFEFEDANGVKGKVTAKVDWIDTAAPTVDVEYELNSEKKLLVLLDNISEDVYLLDQDNKKINYVKIKDNKISTISYLDEEGKTYKTVEVDENGEITKITYRNTNVTGAYTYNDVYDYVTIINNAQVVTEQYLNKEGRVLNPTEEEKETLRGLQGTMSNPLEYVLETNGEYEFKLLDKASNLTCKNIKVDYINNETTIIASDITYNITALTNKDVVATINPYIIDTNNEKDLNVEITNNNNSKEHTFTDNGEFTFEYKSSADVNNLEIREHTAKVDWIDKVAPTAEIKYSTQETTTDKVEANLVNESEEITIINNGDSRRFEFFENGEFTFEFVDKAGNKGTAVAKVDWIRKEQEQPNKYKIGDINKDGKITATDLLLLKRHLVAGEKQEWILVGDKFQAGDINEDGKITATDLLLIKRLVLKQIES